MLQTCAEPLKNFKFIFPSLEEHFRFLAGLTDFRVKQVALYVRHDYDNRTSAMTWRFEEGEITYGKKRESMKEFIVDFSNSVRSLKLLSPTKNPSRKS